MRNITPKRDAAAPLLYCSGGTHFTQQKLFCQPQGGLAMTQLCPAEPWHPVFFPKSFVLSILGSSEPTGVVSC